MAKKVYQERHPNSGLVVYVDVKNIFDELVIRLGKAETMRRLGISNTFFSRRRTSPRVQRRIVADAIRLLMEIRASNENRTREEIRYNPDLRAKRAKLTAAKGAGTR